MNPHKIKRQRQSWNFKQIFFLANTQVMFDFISIVCVSPPEPEQSLEVVLNPIRGAESACTFFRWLFLPEKGGHKVRNFLTFPNSL